MNMQVDTKANLDLFGFLCLKMPDTIIALVKHMAPELRGNIPFTHGWNIHVHHDEDVIVMLLHDASGVKNVKSFNADYLKFIKDELTSLNFLTFENLNNHFGERFYGIDSLLYIGPSFDKHTVKDIFKAVWPNLGAFIGLYVEQVLIPKLYALEKDKISKLIPLPQIFNLRDITPTLWILECEKSFKQGTAFALHGQGLITCEHVLGPKTKAFQAHDYTKKYQVNVTRKHDLVDLAVLEIEGFDIKNMLDISIVEPKQIDQVVVAGFPNYQYGDTGTIIIGNVAGFRMKSGIRRLLVSTPLIAGNSGSPVLDVSSKVIGVAVTGAERMDVASETEEHGVIPISALDLI